jgi:predicted ATPase
MIKQLNITGFKSFVTETIDFGGLTLLTGLNSSGKSSIIQALLILEKVDKGEKNILLEGHGDFDELKNPYEEDAVGLEAICDSGRILIEKCEPIIGADMATLVPIFPRIIYVSANRFGPEVSLPITPNDMSLGNRGENVLNVIRKNADEELNHILRHENSEGFTFEYNLRAWLGVISPGVKFDYKIQKESDSSFTLFNEHRSKNVGFGLSYTLPVITALLLGTITPNSLVIIENPEAHLHPKGQTEMARLISLCVQAGTQVIIETHSDHLFNGIRIQAKKDQNHKFAEMVKLYWFELDEKNNTKVEDSTLTNDGRLDNWPSGLFDQFEINASELL